MSKFQSSQDILKELRQQRDMNPNQHITVPTQPVRTLLLMGPTRAGKSTIINTLRDSLYEPQGVALFSGTRGPELQQIGGLRLIDMPGFNDLQIQTKNLSLSNNSILTMLENQLNDNDPVHLVAFVFNLSSGIKQEDINAMLFVQSNLPHLAKRTMLVVTHAEELNNQEKDRLIEEFFDHPDVKRHKIRNFFKEEILFIGCLRYESFKQKNYTALVNEHQNVLVMRKKFIEKCFEELSLSNNERFNNSYTVSRSVRYYVFAILTVCILFGTFIPFGNDINDISKKANLTADLVNISTMETNTTLIDENIGLQSNLNNSQDYDRMQLSNIDQSSNDTVDKLAPDIVSDITPNPSSTQSELSSHTDELLKMIYMELKELNQRNQFKDIIRLLENIEHTLKELTVREKD